MSGLDTHDGQHRPAQSIEPSPTPAAHEQRHTVSQLPTLKDDPAKLFVDHYVATGGDSQKAAIEFNLWVDALEAVERGELKLPGVDGPRLVRDVQRFTNKRFRESSGWVQDYNIHHTVMMAMLYKSAIDQLETGDLPNYPANPQAAAIVREYVDERFTQRQLGE